MAAIIARIKAEPVLAISVVASIVVLVAQQLLVSGIVSSAGAVNWLNFIIGVAPLIAGILTRGRVSPA